MDDPVDIGAGSHADAASSHSLHADAYTRLPTDAFGRCHRPGISTGFVAPALRATTGVR